MYVLVKWRSTVFIVESNEFIVSALEVPTGYCRSCHPSDPSTKSGLACDNIFIFLDTAQY